MLGALAGLLILILGSGRDWGRYVNAENANAFFHRHLQRRERWQYDIACYLKNNLSCEGGEYSNDSAGMIAYWTDLRILGLPFGSAGLTA